MNLSSPILILLIAQAFLILSGCIAPKVDKKPALQLPQPSSWESSVSTTDKNHSSSGWAYKLAGRVGDSPIIGAGVYCDNEVGAACATGMGEAIIKICGSHTIVELMRNGSSPQEACKIAIQRIKKSNKNLKDIQVGFIAMNKKGEIGSYSLYSGFNYAYQDAQESKLIDSKYDLEWEE